MLLEMHHAFDGASVSANGREENDKSIDGSQKVAISGPVS